MGFISSAIEALGPAGLVLKAILVSLLGILLLVGFIILRRWYRNRYFRRRNGRTVALRAQWEDIVSGKVPPADWRFNQLDAKIETTVQSLKDYTDSRFTQLDTKLGDFGSKVNGLDAKLTKYFELMMQMFTEAHKGIDKILSNHEERISILEGRGAQASRI